MEYNGIRYWATVDEQGQLKPLRGSELSKSLEGDKSENVRRMLGPRRGLRDYPRGVARWVIGKIMGTEKESLIQRLVEQYDSDVVKTERLWLINPDSPPAPLPQPASEPPRGRHRRQRLERAPPREERRVEAAAARALGQVAPDLDLDHLVEEAVGEVRETLVEPAAVHGEWCIDAPSTAYGGAGFQPMTDPGDQSSSGAMIAAKLLRARFRRLLTVPRLQPVISAISS